MLTFGRHGDDRSSIFIGPNSQGQVSADTEHPNYAPQGRVEFNAKNFNFRQGLLFIDPMNPGDAGNNLGGNGDWPDNIWPLNIRAFYRSASTSWEQLMAFKRYNGALKYHINYNDGTTTASDAGLNLAETGVADGRIFIRDGGNVGIGTLKPSCKLEVKGTIDYNTLTKLDVADNFSAVVRCADLYIGHSTRKGLDVGSAPIGRALVDGGSKTLYLNYGPDWENGVITAGNFAVLGNLSKGTGSFIQPHPTDPTKEINYAMFEGRDHRIFFDGVARLKNGEAPLDLPEDFKLVASREKPLNVILTPFGEDMLYVKERSFNRIIVASRERKDIEFGYLVIGTRGGFEESYPIQENTHFRPDKDVSIADFEKRFGVISDKNNPYSTAGRVLNRRLIISNGILTKEGKLNTALVKKLGWAYKLKP